MNLNEILAHTTLRHAVEAQRLWKEYVGPDGPKYQDAMAEGDMLITAVTVAAKLGCTVDEALDMELSPDEPDAAADDAAGGPMGNGAVGEPRVPLPAPGV